MESGGGRVGKSKKRERERGVCNGAASVENIPVIVINI